MPKMTAGTKKQRLFLYVNLIRSCNGTNPTVDLLSVDFSVDLAVTCLEGKVSRGRGW